MKIIPFVREHFEDIDVQEKQSIYSKEMNKDYLISLEKNSVAFSGLVNGKVIGIAGFLQLDVQRAIIFAILDKNSGEHFLAIHKAVRRFLELQPFPRIEAAIDCNFDQAVRWIEMLGFEKEGRMKKYFSNNNDAYLYSRTT